MPGRLTQSTIVAALTASALSFATAAHADRVAFSVALGGPGYAVAFGNAPYGGTRVWPAYACGPRRPGPGWHPIHAWAPAGYVALGYAPLPLYAVPAAGYVVSTLAPPVVYAPRAVYAPAVVHRRHYARGPVVERYRDYRGDHDRD